MAERGWTVAELARRTGQEPDEVLIALWDIGLEALTLPGDAVPKLHRRAAADALGLDEGDRVRTLAYWCQRLQMTDAELRDLLQEMGFRPSRRARTLPKGAASRLKKRMTTPAPVSSQAKAPKLVAPAEPFEWRIIGRERPVQQLSEQDVNTIHWHLVGEFKDTPDPIAPPGIRDETLFSAAVARPLTSHGDTYKYPTVEMAAAALVHSLALNHAFHNGNKRTALVSMCVLLDRNNVALMAGEDDALRFILRIANHALIDRSLNLAADREVLAIAEWICVNQRSFTHGDRPLQFRAFRRILTDHGCDLWFPGGRGNRINISRTIKHRLFWGKVIERQLQTQIAYRNEGSDVVRSTINKVRSDLQLDEEHGFDSDAFYVSGVEAIDQVVAQYQSTLKRLARL
jgi:death-on-curing family protein